MERSRVTLITLICVLVSNISGEEVKMKVRPGDNITIYSDCVWKSGFKTVWFRNCSHDHQPPLMISTGLQYSNYNGLPQYSFLWNDSFQTHDLLVKNITKSDLGLYYCAIYEKKVNKENKSGIIHSEDIYHYGNRTTRLSLYDQTTSSSSSPGSGCSVCWKLLVSVCPVCVLLSSVLSSTCVYWIFGRRTKAGTEVGKDQRNKESRKSTRTNKVDEDEICYASLDLPNRRTKRLKKKRVENSDFCTYSEVKTSRM